MTDQNPHNGNTPADRERVAAPVDETPALDNPEPAARAGEHRSVPASAHANSGARDRDHLPSTVDAPQYGVGPFSVREVALLGIWVVAFLVSFFRINILDSPSGVLIGGLNVWLSGLWWIPTVALPTVAVGLLVLRRLSPQGIRRVGSLGIDQFASVAFTVSAFVWFSWVWDTVVIFNETGIWTRSWVIWVEAVVLLAGVVLTVFGPVVPPFSEDFRGRDEVPAHRSARPIRPVVARPRAPRAPRRDEDRVSAHPGGEPPVRRDDDAAVPGSYTGSTDTAHDAAAPRTTVLPATAGDDSDTDVFAPLRADRDEQADGAERRSTYRSDDDRRDDRGLDDRPFDERPSDDEPRDDDRHGDRGSFRSANDGQRSADETHRTSDRGSRDAHDEHPHAQAFWALAPERREIVDDYGTPIFHIGPTAWALVVEDRGETFVVRHDDGRIGYLHDVSGVTRG